MKRSVLAFAAGLLALATVEQAEAAVTAKVSLTQQRMDVFVDGALVHTWAVSTGRKDFETPAGSYTTQWLDKDHRSQKYDDAPMPYSVFFRGGYAVHGTTATAMLGRRASHGCVRLSTPNAQKFFELVRQHGVGSSKVVIHDAPAERANRPLVADSAEKRQRAARSPQSGPARQASASQSRGTAMPTPAYGYPPAAYVQPVMVYQIGANGQMIPVGYRRF